jgi:hypothetical protein
MNYKVKFGYSCTATFSNMEKAALAMRCIAEADCGVEDGNGRSPVIELTPVWPAAEKSLTPEIGKLDGNTPTQKPEDF